MTLDILLIPAMSDKVERVFSGARRTILWEKTQIESLTIEMVEYIKYWKKSEILNQIII